MSDLQRCPYKFSLIKNELDIHVFYLLQTNKKIIHLLCYKNASHHIIISDYRIKGYQWESGPSYRVTQGPRKKTIIIITWIKKLPLKLLLLIFLKQFSPVHYLPMSFPISTPGLENLPILSGTLSYCWTADQSTASQE